MIRFTAIGHACNLIETEALTLLCDPQLHDGYSQQLFTFWPGRTVHWEALPTPDVLFLSHRHRDHFHLPSLAHLPRHVPVICPKDREIIYGLQQLRFTDLNPIDDWDETTIAGVRLVITPSRYRVPEHGLLLMTPHESLWNMVDTVVDDEIVAEVHRRLGAHHPLDLLLWPYQPLMETQVTENSELCIPWANYSAALAVLAAIRPRYVVPYADGQVGIGCTAWLNHYRFPVAARAVPRTVAHAAPDSTVLDLQPGDRVQQTVGTLRQLAPVPWIAPTLPQKAARSFDPTSAVPPLATLSLQQVGESTVPLAETLSHLQTRWQRMVADVHLAPYLTAAQAWRVHYEFLLELPEAALYRVEFTPGHSQVTHRRATAPTVTQGGIVLRIPVGVLERLLDGRLHYVAAYLGGLFRSWEAVYRVTEVGLVRPRFFEPTQTLGAQEPGSLLGPAVFLNLLLTQEPLLWQRIVDYELQEATNA